MSKSKGARTALIALAVGEICLTTGCKRGIQSAEFEVASVKRATLIENVTATGQLSAVVSVDVGSQISGTIAKLYVDFNSPVVAERQNVLSIPNTALRFVPSTGTKIDNRDAGLAISAGQRLVYLAAANGSAEFVPHFAGSPHHLTGLSQTVCPSARGAVSIV